MLYGWLCTHVAGCRQSRFSHSRPIGAWHNEEVVRRWFRPRWTKFMIDIYCESLAEVRYGDDKVSH